MQIYWCQKNICFSAFKARYKLYYSISREKSNTCETKYVESNGTQDTANQEMYTNKTESFDKYIHSNSKTAKSPR